MNEFARTINAIAAALARRTGRAPDDMRVRVLAGAVVGAMMAIFLPDSADDPAAASPRTMSARTRRIASTRHWLSWNRASPSEAGSPRSPRPAHPAPLTPTPRSPAPLTRPAHPGTPRAEC